MASSYVLLTGFEPYGGRSSNPAYEVMRALDGKELAGASIVGRALPVSFASLPGRISNLLDDIDPIVVLSLGLWPGEPVIRLERLATNVADFEIADNLGQSSLINPCFRVKPRHSRRHCRFGRSNKLC